MKVKQVTLRQPAPEPPSADLIEKVLLAGDLSQLTPEQRLNYYKSVCDALGLNPLTKPFDYIVLDSKLVLYARKDCTEQLRKRYNISLKITSRAVDDNVYSVTAQAQLPNNRMDEAIGAVPLESWKDGKTHPLSALGKANAIMKAETKAKRRVTLSICGLGMLDESELDTVYDYDQREPDEITERNVREAVANATGEPPPVAEVTRETYRDVICHIGKAKGELLGKKVGEIKRPLIKWLAENWIPKLPPIPNDKDKRLRDAVLFAVSEPAPDLNAVELANALIKRAEDLVLTPDQFCRLLRDQGLLDQNKTLTDMPLSILQHLMTDEGWNTLKTAHEVKAKPKVNESKKPKKRKKEKGPFDV
jgi:hypothetical protein